jgi:nucleoside-diphosphate-sugar epimerase
MLAPLRVLISGAGGYIGRHVTRALLDQGNEVIAVGRVLDAARMDPRATLISTDIFDVTEPFETFGRPDVCLHLAWESGFDHNSVTHMLNLSRHFRFLTELVDGGLRQLLVLGSMHEIGYFEGAISEDTPTSPQSLYGIAKDSLRRALTVYLDPGTTVFQWARCFYIYGDDEHNESIFTRILESASLGQSSFPFTSGSKRFDFISIEQLADQIGAIAQQTETSGVINCGSGVAVTLKSQVEMYISDRSLTLELEYGAYPDRPYDSPAVWAETSKIRTILDRRDAVRTESPE